MVHYLHFRFVIEHVAYVEATDDAGKTSQAKIHFILLDVNDSPPKFKKRVYQGFMNSDLTRLRNDVQVEVRINVLILHDVIYDFLFYKMYNFKGYSDHFLVKQAIDADKADTKNSQLRYEIIAGNYEKKFGIDESTGKIFVIEPLGVYTGIDYDALSKSDYVDADMQTSKLHTTGRHKNGISKKIELQNLNSHWFVTY